MSPSHREPGDKIICYVTYNKKTGKYKELFTVRKGADDEPDYSDVIFCFLNHIGRA